MKRLVSLLMVGSAMLVTSACKESAVSGIGGGGGMGGSSTSSTGAGGKSSGADAGSTSHTGAGGNGSGGGCTGDAATWAQLTAGPIHCTSNADCCVIINDCTNEAQIVSAANQAAAKAAWPTCQDKCTGCIPPAVEVGCVGGVCGGEAVPLPDASTELLMDHCGTVPVGASPAQLHYTCGG